jgi:hypothetical protein
VPAIEQVELERDPVRAIPVFGLRERVIELEERVAEDVIDVVFDDQFQQQNDVDVAGRLKEPLVAPGRVLPFQLGGDPVVLAQEDRADGNVANAGVAALEPGRIQLSFSIPEGRREEGIYGGIGAQIGRRAELLELRTHGDAGRGLAAQVLRVLLPIDDLATQLPGAVVLAQQARRLLRQAVDLAEVDIVVRGVLSPVEVIDAQHAVGEPLCEEGKQQAGARRRHAAGADEQ